MTVPHRHSASEPSPPPEPCPSCRQWESGPGDSYCGFCGRLLVKLSVKPEVVPLISGLAAQRIVVFGNSGPDPLQIKILPEGRPFRAVAFDPPEFDVAAGRKTGVRALLDERALPENFVSRRVDLRCQINGDGRKIFPFAVEVKAGPTPLVTPTRLSFGGLEEGVTARRRIEVRNTGGVPLMLRGVTPVGSSQLRLAADAALPIKVAPADSAPVEVVWDTTLEESGEGGSERRGFELAFANYGEELFVEAVADVFRRQLKIDPETLHLPNVFAKHDRLERMKLKNLGTVEIEVVKIESRADWIEVVSEKDRFELRPEGSYGFELVFHPQALTAGPHRGTVEVFTADQEEPRIVEVRLEVLHPGRYDDYIGIDFGTTNSVVALWNPAGKQRIELVEPGGSGSALIPSLLVFLSGENSYVTGFEAQREADTRPERAVRSIKRVMGARNEHQFFGKRFSPEALATRIIRGLVEQAERRLFELSGTYFDVQKAIVTVPANFFDLQIRGILKACADAGIDTEEEQARAAYQAVKKAIGKAVNAGIIIDEPSAAALFYLGHLEEDQAAPELYRRIESENGLRALIFDHGGGTLDVSLAHVRKLPSGQTGITVRANRGDNRVGGESLDLELMKAILARCRDQLESFDDSLVSAKFRELEARRRAEGWDLGTWNWILGARNQWKSVAEKVKIALSDTEETEFEMLGIYLPCREDGRLTGASRDFATRVTRDDLLVVSKTMLDRCEAVVLEVLEVAGVEPREVDYVFHTGRQSLMPAIRDRVRSVFGDLEPGHDILDAEHLKVCVAKGAALYGMVKRGMGDAGVVFLDEGRRLPHSYGVEKIIGIAQRRFEEVLPKGIVYPARAEKRYGPEVIAADGWLNLKIYENTGADTRIVGNPDVRQIGQISIDTLADGVPGADLVFAIDANRQLKVVVDEEEVPIEPESWEDEEGWMW